METRRRVRKKKSKKKFKPAIFFTGIIYITLFLAITGPLVLLYGPFDITRKMVLETVLATRHAYWVTDLIPQDSLDKMLGKNSSSAGNSDTQNLNAIDVKHKGSNKITRYNLTTKNFNGYILEIENPNKVKVAMTKYLGKIGQKTSQMAEEHNAIAAINGGTFVDYSSDGTQYGGTGAEPGGFVISDGKVIFPKNITETDENTVHNVTAITYSGKLIVGNHSLAEIRKMDVREAMCFRDPTIIIGGKGQIVDKYKEGRNPRTAIGQKADGTIVFLVTDGRKLSRPGALLYDVQEIMLERGVVNAGFLDGGYSSTMYYNGEVLNEINAWDGERTVATAYYVEE